MQLTSLTFIFPRCIFHDKPCQLIPIRNPPDPTRYALPSPNSFPLAYSIYGHGLHATLIPKHPPYFFHSHHLHAHTHHTPLEIDLKALSIFLYYYYVLIVPWLSSPAPLIFHPHFPSPSPTLTPSCKISIYYIYLTKYANKIRYNIDAMLCSALLCTRYLLLSQTHSFHHIISSIPSIPSSAPIIYPSPFSTSSLLKKRSERRRSEQILIKTNYNYLILSACCWPYQPPAHSIDSITKITFMQSRRRIIIQPPIPSPLPPLPFQAIPMHISPRRKKRRKRK